MQRPQSLLWEFAAVRLNGSAEFFPFGLAASFR